MSHAIHVTAGNHAGPKSQRGLEIYQTPACAVEALLRAEPLPQHLLDPCGPDDSELVRTLVAHGHEVTAFALAIDGIDFLTMKELPASTDAMVTNPPFSKAADFVRHALTLVPKVVVLERVQFLETRRRAELFRSCGLARVHVFSDRVPRMHPVGWTGKQASPAMCLGWFVFERGYGGRPTLNFLELP
jgi:hypothetical protein